MNDIEEHQDSTGADGPFGLPVSSGTIESILPRSLMGFDLLSVRLHETLNPPLEGLECSPSLLAAFHSSLCNEWPVRHPVAGVVLAFRSGFMLLCHVVDGDLHAVGKMRGRCGSANFFLAHPREPAVLIGTNQGVFWMQSFLKVTRAESRRSKAAG